VSLISTTSHFASSSLCDSTNRSRFTDPDSSSPSISTVNGTPPAALPDASFHARIASRNIVTCPLSSCAPRATTRSPTLPSAGLITGSNGGLSHSSTGSAGCTS
jgi:hypothetical protein